MSIFADPADSYVAINTNQVDAGSSINATLSETGIRANISNHQSRITTLEQFGFNPRKYSYLFDDFLGDDAVLASTGHAFLGAYCSAAAANAYVLTHIGALNSGDHPGIAELSTGTTTTGSARIQYGGVKPGAGAQVYEWLIRIEDLSTAGEEYDLEVGLVNATTDQIAFIYNRNASVNWARKTMAASTPTGPTANASFPVTEDAWIRLRIEINAAGTQVDFYIDESLHGSNTTNIPTTGLKPYIYILKSAGSTARKVYCDYYYTATQFTTPR